MAGKRYDWKVGSPPPELGHHSLAKHRIIRRYVERYIDIVTATSSQERLNLTFVDGYSGGGQYRMGAELLPGSPLILLETVAAKEAELKAKRSKGFSINADFYFIDENANHTGFLRSQIENSVFKDRLDKSIHIWTADFNTKVSDLVAAVRRRSPRAGRAIFLLDQYGWSQVAFASIRQILADLPKSEVFLTFSVDALINFMSEKKNDLKAFGAIDVDPGFVRELIRFKESEQVGYRALIQNALYKHVQDHTGALFYSPFFIKSPEAHRSYWFIHLSQHREARNEIGNIHWQENNTTAHHGRAGLHALGFSPGSDPEQYVLDYVFDDHARGMSKDALKEQLPKLIFETAQSSGATTVETIFGQHCNDTPVVRTLLESALCDLRTEQELVIVDLEGNIKPRSKVFDWTDRIELARQRKLFGPFGAGSPKEPA